MFQRLTNTVRDLLVSGAVYSFVYGTFSRDTVTFRVELYPIKVWAAAFVDVNPILFRLTSQQRQDPPKTRQR